MCVSLSRAHGGCGKTHSRPVAHGAPVKLWAFTQDDCAACERVLHADPLWSATIARIPETHDEKIVREDQEERGQRDAVAGQAQALQQLASLSELPGIMKQLGSLFANGQNAIPAMGSVRCEKQHVVPAGARFCPECGSAIEDAVPQAERVQRDVQRGLITVDEGRTQLGLNPFNIPETQTPQDAVTQVEDAPPTTREYLEGLTLPGLKDYARQLGARIARTKPEQLRLILDKLGE